MTDTQPLPILATHSGKFHCDEVFAYAVLRLALGLHTPGQDHVLRRTRNAELIESADIVWDVGSIFDAGARRFDHHQRGAPVRADGTPFSSAGLVWQVYGQRAVAALLPPGNTESFAKPIADELEGGIVRRIDEIDNGVAADGPLQRDTLSLATLIGEYNPSWDAPDSNGPTAGDAAFLEAASLAEGVLRRRVDGLRARLQAESLVLAAHDAGSDPRLLVLDRGMPWKNVVFSHDLPVLFAISPASNGNWMLDTMPPEPGSFAQRLPSRKPGPACRRQTWPLRAASPTRSSSICAASSAPPPHAQAPWRWRKRLWKRKISVRKRFFFEKRTKKLLLLWRGLPERTATAT